MVDLKARIKAKFIRRQPAAPSIASTNNSESLPHPDATSPSDHHHLTSPRARYPNRDQLKSRNGSNCRPTSGLVDGSDDHAGSYDLLDADASEASAPSGAACLTSPGAAPTGSAAKLVRPEHAPKLPPTAAASLDLAASSTLSNLDSINEHAQPDVNRPLGDTQREPQAAKLILSADDNDHSSADDIPIVPHPALMMARKIWVKRDSGGSATLITVREDDLVDDVRETILKKYANSLGRDFDAPDLTLRIVPRDSAASSRKQHSRVLGPEQLMFEVLDTYYPDGQTVDDALVVEISQTAPPLAFKQPTPRLSPGPSTHYQHNSDHRRPDESDPDYFGNVANQPSSRIPHGMTPSPGSLARDRRSANARPGTRRAATSSPRDAVGHESGSKVVGHPNGTQRPAPRPTHSRSHSSISEKTTGGASGTPSGGSTIHHHLQQTSPPSSGAVDHSHIPTPPAARPSSPKPKKGKKSRVMDDPPPHSLPSSHDLISASVPPINVLIVEDNKINLSLLGAFVKRLRLRWATAMDGKQAVDKWRTGGFHLVLMDIQLPVMNGLDATREIRRLERANSIGVFTSSASSATVEVADDIPDSDRLPAKELFKSPVIIVALTASSLQSDRHDALAAGCNDFLTKPVNFTWLERKVMEWGCMQALIDFRGWKEWKELSEKNQSAEAAKKTAAQKVKSKRKTNRVKGEGGSEVAAAA